MQLAQRLLPFLLLGLAGSLHCAGMCGPFALSLARSRGGTRGAWLRATCYLLGKSASYALLAVIVAVTSVALARAQPSWLGATRSALAWLAGITMLVVALNGLGLAWTSKRLGFGPLTRATLVLSSSARSLPQPAASLGLGLANGLLPCGLSWAAIALAASSSLSVAALGPFVFGLGTGPMLASIMLFGVAAPLAWRVRGQRVLAVLLLAFGVLTIARGGLPRSTLAEAVLPECCDDAPAH